jgi:hypothetical protein
MPDTPIEADRGSGGEVLGERLTLPGAYVREHVALAYASTVHAAQGLTVDTAHTIATGRTSRAALYVGMSRGRHANTAHVVTLAVPDDAPPGAVQHAPRRDPLAVLSHDDDPCAVEDLAALSQAERNAADAGSLRTLHERFTDACQVATAGRVAGWLDQLTAAGHLTNLQRTELAADQGSASLELVLRQAELAGHHPHQVLTGAVLQQDLAGARSLASVLHHRIATTHDLRSRTGHYADRVPAVDNQALKPHLTALADAADTRCQQLGEYIADTQPRWAVDAFGPLPDDHGQERAQWVTRAAAVAAYRDLADHVDPDIALPTPPEPGRIEAFASWRAAANALGHDQPGRAEAELSDGQLLIRVRAYQRELTWQPDYVAPALAATLQAENRHRAAAALRAAAAEAEPDPVRRADLEHEAGQAGALAEALRRRAADLEIADEIRGRWYAHTAETRAAADRARVELAHRGINPDRPRDVVSVANWLDDHRADQAAEDAGRPIRHAADIADVVAQRDTDLAAIPPESAATLLETNIRDIREHTAAEPARAADADGHDWTRVPTAQEAADTIARAQRALAELQRRRLIEEQRHAEEVRMEQLTRWRTDHGHVRDLQVRQAHRDLELST